METNEHSWSHLAKFLLEWKIFYTNFVVKITTHIYVT
jgi:hypothetical protein